VERKFKKSQKGILGMNKIMSALKHPSQVTGTPKAECELRQIPESEVKSFQKLIADIATAVWRMRDKFKKVNIDDLPDEITKAHRHLESIWDTLKNAKVEIRDHTGEKFPQGNPALKVIASQPTPSVQYEVITETIKPTIYYNGKLIQMGQVIVEAPQSTKSNEKLTDANASSGTSSKQNDKNSAKRSGEKTARTKNEKELDKNKERDTK